MDYYDGGRDTWLYLVKAITGGFTFSSEKTQKILKAAKKAAEASDVTAEDEEAIDDEKREAFDKFVEMTSDPLLKAVEKCRAEQSRSQKLAKEARGFSDKLARVCGIASGQEYGPDELAGGFGSGFYLWVEAREALDNWGEEAASSDEGSDCASWFR